MKAEIETSIRDLQEHYRINQGVGSNGVSRCLFDRLKHACTTFDEFLLVVIAFHNNGKKNNLLLPFIRSAIEQANSIERFRAIWPYIPLSWKNERRTLFLMAAGKATGIEELRELIDEFVYF